MLQIMWNISHLPFPVPHIWRRRYKVQIKSGGSPEQADWREKPSGGTDCMEGAARHREGQDAVVHEPDLFSLGMLLPQGNAPVSPHRPQ